VEIKHEVGNPMDWCPSEIETCPICRENYELFIDEETWPKKPRRKAEGGVSD